MSAPAILCKHDPRPRRERRAKPDAAPTLLEIRGWPATVDVRQACRAVGISPAWGYELIKRGEFPCRVLRIAGGRCRVITASLVALLETTEP